MRNLRFLDWGLNHWEAGPGFEPKHLTLTLKHSLTAQVTRPVYVLWIFLSENPFYIPPFKRWSLPPLSLWVWARLGGSPPTRSRKLNRRGVTSETLCRTSAMGALSGRTPTAMRWGHSSNSAEEPIQSRNSGILPTVMWRSCLGGGTSSPNQGVRWLQLLERPQSWNRAGKLFPKPQPQKTIINGCCSKLLNME